MDIIKSKIQHNTINKQKGKANDRLGKISAIMATNNKKYLFI